MADSGAVGERLFPVRGERRPRRRRGRRPSEGCPRWVPRAKEIVSLAIPSTLATAKRRRRSGRLRPLQGRTSPLDRQPLAARRRRHRGARPQRSARHRRGAGRARGPTRATEARRGSLLRLHDLLPQDTSTSNCRGAGERDPLLLAARSGRHPKALVRLHRELRPNGLRRRLLRLSDPAGTARRAGARRDRGADDGDPAGADAAWDVCAAARTRLLHRPPAAASRPRRRSLGSRDGALPRPPSPLLLIPSSAGSAPSCLLPRLAIGQHPGRRHGGRPDLRRGDDGGEVELARRQQAAHPPADALHSGGALRRRSGALDDPALETPAYWLAAILRPGGGLPDNPPLRVLIAPGAGSRINRTGCSKKARARCGTSATRRRPARHLDAGELAACSPTRRPAGRSPAGNAPRTRSLAAGSQGDDLRRLREGPRRLPETGAGGVHRMGGGAALA